VTRVVEEDKAGAVFVDFDDAEAGVAAQAEAAFFLDG
jgi:hypothetical protein